MYTRRETLKLGLLAGTALAMPAMSTRAFAQSDSLVFDPSDFTELTTAVTTSSGDKEVTYRFYKAIPYVANPVDVAYQSLNISVPTAIDGVPVDASAAPILFANSIGGYMPSSVAEAEGIDGSGGMMGPPPGAMGDVGAPNDGEAPSGSSAMLDSGGGMVSNAELALAAGYVVIQPGARGRTLTDDDGVYFGVAPAAIVDLKAALRYIHFNAGRIPGNVDRIVSSGTSAGGALSSLLGASAGSSLYEPYLAELGAADASDALFAVGAWCPITDLEHADMAYEWNWGANPLQNGDLVDQAISNELQTAFADYQVGLGLTGKDGFGPLNAKTYGDYIVKTYLQPAAETYLNALSEADRASYLSENGFIDWTDGKASFTWWDFLDHVGARKKSVPAFDAFDLSAGENNLFGLGTSEARHFTSYSLRQATNDPTAEIDADLPATLDLMNPMYFLGRNNPDRSKKWWIRVGAEDSDSSLTVVANLSADLENKGDLVNTSMYWDAGHGANEDAEDFIRWISTVSGYESAQ